MSVHVVRQHDVDKTQLNVKTVRFLSEEQKRSALFLIIKAMDIDEREAASLFNGPA